MGNLAGKTILVTGSTSGIGRAVAQELAAAGAAVAIHGRRANAANELVAEIGGLPQGSVAGTFLADVASPEGCQQLVEAVARECPTLDAVCLVAGADTLTGAGAGLTFQEKLQLLYDIDIRSTLLLGRAFGQQLSARGGSIVTIGWDQADVGMAGDSGELFATVKGAVMAFTKSLAKSLAPTVRVNCVAPGWIKTAWGHQASREWQERAIGESLVGRWGEPKDIAAAVHWLVSPQASFVTGQVLNINGGFRTGPIGR